MTEEPFCQVSTEELCEKFFLITTNPGVLIWKHRNEYNIEGRPTRSLLGGVDADRDPGSDQDVGDGGDPHRHEDMDIQLFRMGDTSFIPRRLIPDSEDGEEGARPEKTSLCGDDTATALQPEVIQVWELDLPRWRSNYEVSFSSRVTHKSFFFL